MVCLQFFSVKVSLSGNRKRLSLRQTLDFAILRIKSINHKFESLTYLGTKMWESIPSKIRKKDSLKKFKDKIKQWKPNSCSCRVWTRYMQHVGYI